MTGLSRRLAAVRPGTAEPPAPLRAFGVFAPDAPELSPESLAMAEGVFAREDGSYSPFKELQTISGTPLNSRVSGAASYYAQGDGSAWTFAGTNTSLYESSDYNYTDVSKAGGYAGPLAVGEEEYWEFCQFRERVIATQIGAPVQTKTIGAAGLFSDLITSTNKPQARHAATVGNFLVLGNTTDTTDGNRPSRVWWSGFGNPVTFDPDAATQSDFEDLATGGPVQRVIGGQDYGLILQTDQIRRMAYQPGNPAIFSLYPVDRTRGTPIPRSVAARGRLVFYVAEEGFQIFDGAESIPIGAGYVDRSFWSTFDINQRNACSAALDTENKLAILAYPSNGGDQGRANRLAIVNYATSPMKWSFVDFKVEHLFEGLTLGINVDTADSRLDDIDNSIWSNESLDSALFQGGRRSFSGFNYAHTQGLLTGQNSRMMIETKDLDLVPGLRSFIDRCRPIIEGPGLVSIGYRDDLSQPVVFTDAVPKNGNGLSSFGQQFNSARYHRIRLENPAGAQWDRALGYQVYARNDGAYNGG